MKIPWTAVAALVVVFSNAVLLWNGSSNQSGAPESELELTDREVRPSYGNEDSSQVELFLVWTADTGAVNPRGFDWAGRSPVWLDRQKLASLGFDVSVPPESSRAEIHYLGALQRRLFVALEMDGPAYRDLAAKRAAAETKPAPSEPSQPGSTKDRAPSRPAPSAPTRLEAPPSGEPPAANPESLTRLVLVDAASDPGTLRAKYPDTTKVMIRRARVRVSYHRHDEEARLVGTIDSLEPESIYVPQPVAGSFPKYLGRVPSPPAPGAEPRFRLKLRVGSEYAPFVQGIVWLIPPTDATPKKGN
jgi:hypothetical protein